MNRTPPSDVRRVLRQEVGFGCPVPGCGSPYLTWHHFDPPWNVREHHNPDGMIALCRLHHDAADAGAFTADQLRAFKIDGSAAATIRGQFHWLRNRLLAVVGGNFYYEQDRMIALDDVDVISFSRDEEGYLRLNVRVLSLKNEERAIIEENFWTSFGNPIDLRAPPSGKELEIKYESGDYIFIQFLEIENIEQIIARYGATALSENGFIQYPVTVVEINYAIGGTNITLTSSGSSIGNFHMVGGFFSRNAGSGVNIATNGLRLFNTPE